MCCKEMVYLQVLEVSTSDAGRSVSLNPDFTNGTDLSSMWSFLGYPWNMLVLLKLKPCLDGERPGI